MKSGRIGIVGDRRAPLKRALAVVFIFLAATPGFAGDWPQILGPQRDGRAENEKLLDTWPKAGPKVLWERKVGSGFAGLAVAQERAILFHREGKAEWVEALDPGTGKVLWKKSFPTGYRGTYVEDNGPRCVPIIHGEQVVLFGAEGDLHALSLKTGDPIWSRKAAQDYGADLGYFGAGSTPIVDGDKLLVNVGGDKQDAGIVAFSLTDGKTLWKGTRELPSYSAPTSATVDGTRHVIFATRLNVVSVNPDDGQVRFKFPFGKRGPTVNAATPLVFEGHLFVTANYGVGAVFAKIGKSDAQMLWESDDLISSQYTTCIYHAGHLFGVDGQDSPEVPLRCIDPRTKSITWSQERFGMSSLLLADGKLLLLKTSGELVLAEADPQKYSQLASARVLTSTTRALPALSNGRLFVRDMTTLKCLEVGKLRE